MDKDSKFTRDEEGYVAVRVLSGAAPSANDDKESMFTRDEEGYVAVRVVNGAGGGGGGDQHNLGWFSTLSELQTAYPTAEAGDWAIVGATDTVWIWDTDNSEWVDSDQKGQVTSVNNQTGAVTLGINDVAPTQTDKSGYVLGTDGFVAGWVKPEIVQRSTMPQASEEEVGKIYQYVGTTDANYTNGYFYKCVSDGQTPATYSWTQTDVQPSSGGGGLPDQTGNSGKFLTTDGTNASWGNTLSISGQQKEATYDCSGINIKHTTSNYSKNGTLTFSAFDASTGMWNLQYFGGGKKWLCYYGNVLDIVWTKALSAADHYLSRNNIIQIPNIAGTMVVADYTGATAGQVLTLDSNLNPVWQAGGGGGSSPTQTNISIAPMEWQPSGSSYYCNVGVMGVTYNSIVFVSAQDPNSMTDWANCKIMCTNQAPDQLTFECETIPNNTVSINIVIFN